MKKECLLAYLYLCRQDYGKHSLYRTLSLCTVHVFKDLNITSSGLCHYFVKMFFYLEQKEKIERMETIMRFLKHVYCLYYDLNERYGSPYWWLKGWRLPRYNFLGDAIQFLESISQQELNEILWPE